MAWRTDRFTAIVDGRNCQHFGSLNGTHVNGQSIGQRDKGMSPEDAAQLKFTDHNRKHGDKVELGNTVFQVEVYVPAVCADCSVEIPEEQRSRLEYAPGLARCPACRQKAEAAHIKSPPTPYHSS